MTFGSVGAGLQHGLVQLSGLSTGVTWNPGDQPLNHFLTMCPCKPIVLSFTVSPEKHFPLEVGGLCAGDGNQDIVKGHAADLLDLLLSEEAGGTHVVIRGGRPWPVDHGEGAAHPFCRFSNQKRSPFLVRSNWSRMIAVKTRPGPSSDSSSPPGKSSSLETSPSYSSSRSWRSYEKNTVRGPSSR